jgi:hypothetical protein
MKMAESGFRPAPNIQRESDTNSTAMAMISLDNIGSDMGKMAPMNDALAGYNGERPRQHLVDGVAGAARRTKNIPRIREIPSMSGTSPRAIG